MIADMCDTHVHKRYLHIYEIHALYNETNRAMCGYMRQTGRCVGTCDTMADMYDMYDTHINKRYVHFAGNMYISRN